LRFSRVLPRRQVGAGRLALRFEAAGAADAQVMQQRIGRVLALQPALFEVKGAVEIGMRVTPLAGPLFEEMNQRIDIAFGDIGIRRNVVTGIEQARSSDVLVIAEQRFHRFSSTPAGANGNGRVRS
jgi:hypothetical protein